MNPFFSVIIPLFNKENEIKSTLESVLRQTFQDFEVIVIDDGSTDNGKKIVEDLNNSKIKLFTTRNNGVSKARNIGIERAKGALIAFLDADDIWFENHLQLLSDLFIKYPNAGILGTNYEIFYNKNKIVKPYFIDIPKENWSGIVADFFKSSMINRIAWTSAIAIPKKAFAKVGNFDENITLGAGEDTDLWIRMALEFEVAFNNQITVRYNLGAENRISLTKTLTRSFAKLNQFGAQEIENPFLKKYLDLYRTQYALKHKLAGDVKTFNFYKNQINLKNVTWKTKTLFMLPVFILKILFFIKKYLEQKNILFSIYD